MSPTAGYSGTPLPKKLGIKEAHRVALVNAPKGFDETLGALPAGARLEPSGDGRGRGRGRGGDHDVLLLFARDRKTLEAGLRPARDKMASSSALWICWPKKTSSLASDIDGNDVRAAGLASGLVDIKVCAIDEDWSGLKFVFRLKDRGRDQPSTTKKVKKK